MPESIDVNLKRAAVALADERDYTRAAEKLNIDSADLKKQVSELEKTLCLHIFRPRQKLVELTKDGTFLIRVFREAVALHDRADGSANKT